MSLSIDIVPGPLGREVPPWSPDGAGAVLTFEGMVRPIEEDCRIDALDYDAYRPMAERMLESLGTELIGQHSLIAMHIEHSLGAVAPGECAFRLRIASAHRAEGLAALEDFITRMKQDVPIFKKPIWSSAEEPGM